MNYQDIKDIVIPVATAIACILSIWNFVELRRNKSREKDDNRRFAEFIDKQKNNPGAIAYEPGGSEDFGWAERMVQQGKMRRDERGKYFIKN